MPLCGVFLICMIIHAFAGSVLSEAALNECGITHHEKYGGVVFRCSTEEFEQLGFEFGDSVDVSFSNQYSLYDVPYYNGYYVDLGEPVLLGHSGEADIELRLNYGDDIWELAELDGSMSASIVLHEKGKYRTEQIVNDLSYPDEQNDTPDEVFANFRAVTAGNVKENTLYRSASPCDNSRNRAAVVDQLCREANIQYILDLADSEDEIIGYIDQEDFHSPYFLALYENDNVCMLDMDMRFESEGFSEKLAAGLTQMAYHEGPYLIHCQEGKDRTGFVCMVLEALAGASADEIVQDYMETYNNYYGITESSDAEKYSAIRSRNIDQMLAYLLNGETVDPGKSGELVKYAEEYLARIGMEPSDVQALKVRMC